MKTVSILMTLITSSIMNVQASSTHLYSAIKLAPQVIYGVDERLDVYESSDSLMKEIARSTAAQIQNSKFVQDGTGLKIKTETLADRGVCSSERFANQLAAADCSGFLVASDILVTAGHCVNEVTDCDNSSWVFDFANTNAEKSSFTFNKNQIYRCTKIIARQKDSSNMNDYAVLKLDRKVTGRTPLKFRTAGKPADDAVFTVIGYPAGTPVKITSAADMRDNTNPILFRINSDTYGGNSGSAVLDSRTGIVEGILVRGDKDYEQVPGSTCMTSVVRDVNGGRGEDATRITNIKELQEN